MAIRKDHGDYDGPHPYSVSKTLDGEKPGRRVIERLHIRSVDGATTREGLAPLAAFGSIEHLEMDRVSRVDLSPLAAVERLQVLIMRDIEEVDLAPLGSLAHLEFLIITRFSNCPVPALQTMPAGLRSLSIINDGARYSGEPSRALISAIDWSHLSALEELYLRVGGLEPLDPIEVDLAFLSLLPKLRVLKVSSGIRHRGARSSPLAPPFDGLPSSLERVQIDAWEPEPLAAALREKLAGASVSVQQRFPIGKGQASWAIHPPDSGDDRWSTYGSISDAFRGTSGDMESEALARASRMIEAADPALLRRLDFDQESSGTGIAAARRVDLEAALVILGISEAKPG
jgi:hypothetical protein